MIVLHCPASCPFCDELEDTLSQWVLAHRVVPAENGEPWLEEGKQVYRGEEAIRSFLKSLLSEVQFGRQVQSDACYLDPEEPGRCL